MTSNAERIAALFARRCHLLLVDLFPPAQHPGGIHAAVWQRLGFDLLASPEEPLTLASYEAVVPPEAYVAPVAVGDVLPDMPLFLVPGGHVLVPLEATYLAAWEGVPVQARKLLNAGAS